MSIDVNYHGVERVTVGYSRLWSHPGGGIEMAVLELNLGKDVLNIKFVSWAAMIEFCEAHNFPYIDKRGES